ncbi:adenosine deaminase [Metarhizium acridum CQMa 102]|uniref:adenosine deaminase n=1 Tax=Metarhizium acridum (strain CQMa 102) TaxID=655827 RepID=E9E0G5_METAQ|nr:adenosine deaminase [Metarhizium acridum CQMa 102]EFY90585.1 adenosine deaminase [Metarhizium acridum CQMa 102]
MELHKFLNDADRQDKEAASRMVQAQYDDLDARGLSNSPPLDIGSIGPKPNSSEDPVEYMKEYEAAYAKERSRILRQEKDLDFDSRCRANATALEQRVDQILHECRRQDEQMFENQPPRLGHGGQQHQRFAGDHYLSNVDLIPKTALWRVAKQIPKGSHLHNHFNACLPSSFLLDQAAQMPRMHIMGDRSLNPFNLEMCQIQFSIKSEESEKAGPGPENIFSQDNKSGCHWSMKLSEFLGQSKDRFNGLEPMEWLRTKVEFDEEEVHGPEQTQRGSWQLFNMRTRLMKGLFNYETGFRRYTQAYLQNLVEDKILYAELRVTFMESNYLFSDDGKERKNNFEIVGIIAEELDQFKASLTDENAFHHVKVIYCTPRSMEPEMVQAGLDECIKLKEMWPALIAGYDLVGQEGPAKDAKYPLQKFAYQFHSFRQKCEAKGLDLPFLFHCGETLEMGTSTDGNLLDALMLGAKRIGHGFALIKHPHIMQQMKAKGVCLELCPISNEILGLTSRVAGHSMYPLLANNVHCTINADNGTLFRSSLSHDFYQTLAGKDDLGIYGVKQLILWSIQHSCLDDDEKEQVLKKWEQQWANFLNQVVNDYDFPMRPQTLG